MRTFIGLHQLWQDLRFRGRPPWSRLPQVSHSDLLSEVFDTNICFRIFSIGPTFSVNVEATASLDANVDMDVDLAYDVKGMELFFPPGSNSQAGTFTPGDSNLKLSVSPNVTSHGQVAAHLIPSVSAPLPTRVSYY